MPKRSRADGSDSSDEDYRSDEGDEEEEFNEHEEFGKRIARTKTRRIGIRKATVGRSYDPLADDVRVFQDYSKELKLKPDHEKRPIWITADNFIYLEAFSPIYQQAYDFLVAIAEPESRPEFIHIYKLTENSLYAAVAISIDTESIITVLSRLCKTDVPQQVVDYIRNCTHTFGKAKIVLKENKFYIESRYPDILRELLKNPIIRNGRVLNEGASADSSDQSDDSDNNNNSDKNKSNAKKQQKQKQRQQKQGSGDSDGEFETSAAPVEDARNLSYTKLGTADGVEDDEDEDEDMMDEMKASAAVTAATTNSNATGSYSGNITGTKGAKAGGKSAFSGYQSKIQTVSFQVRQEDVQLVKRSAKEESHYPLMEEYDFKNDHNNPVLDIDLRPSTRIRPYQEKSLSKMFGNGRARSGIIVLPCGAGKSLTGVTAASTVKRACIVMCINNESVKQWRDQFTTWTSVKDKSVKLFTSSEKQQLPPATEACIVITTYNMICHGGRRSEFGERMIQSVSSREWGLMILDEVHVAPADMFQKVVHMVNAHCKLGLTATLVREDNKIQDLSFLVGPKLYEANWIDLTNDGYLAKVQCVEVWCPMTKEFYRSYISNSKGGHSRLQRLLYTLNPTKFRACEYLVKYHSERGDKIIIFSDDVPALILYCEALKPLRVVPYIFGGTKDWDRRDYLTAFKTRTELSCIGLSKVGDTALDIPEANVIIQVSSHFGARRQEAQRLGRILRPKPNPTGSYNAFFYTLVSTDTREMYFSTKRQQYLIDQGYTFKVIQNLSQVADKESVLLRTKSQELDLLGKVLSFEYNAYDNMESKELGRKSLGELEDEDYTGSGNSNSNSNNSSSVEVRRKSGNISSISGAGGSVYTEFQSRR